MCTDLTRSDQWALQGYRRRSSCEVDNFYFYLKTQLVLTDFRIHSYEVMDRYMVVVLVAWVYVEPRFHLERFAQIKSYGDLIRRHQDEHVADWLTAALLHQQQCGDIQQVIQRYMRSGLQLAKSILARLCVSYQIPFSTFGFSQLGAPTTECLRRPDIRFLHYS